MRSALGAGRWRLFRQALTESLVLAVAGAALGAGLAAGIVTLLKAIAGQAVPRADAVHIGWPVFAFGFLAAVVAAGIAGVLPAARASLPDRFQGLKGTRTTAGPQRAPAARRRRDAADRPDRRAAGRAPRFSSARRATSIACSPATTPRTSWR